MRGELTVEPRKQRKEPKRLRGTSYLGERVAHHGGTGGFIAQPNRFG